jgi:hypothetical protein
MRNRARRHRETTRFRYPIERAGNLPLRVVDNKTGELLSERLPNGIEQLCVYGAKQRVMAKNALNRAREAGVDARLVDTEEGE